MFLTATVLVLNLFTGAPAAAASDTFTEVPFFADEFTNHYKCYRVEPLSQTPIIGVWLKDQFKSVDARVFEPRYLCNPVKKNNTEPPKPEVHLVCFEIQQEEFHYPDVLTSNQFGEQKLRPVNSELLCLPSKKVHI